MKKNLSVLALIARASQSKMYWILLIMTAVACVIVFCVFDPTSLPLDAIIDTSGIQFVFQIAFVLIAILLNATGCESTSKCGYTLRRLRVSEKRVFILQSVYNSFCFLLLWSLQAVFVIVFCLIYMQVAPGELVNHQTLYLSFHKSTVLFSLLPMTFTIRWMRNLILFICLGIACAYYPFMQRRKTFAFSSIVMIVCASIFFFQDLGAVINDTFLMIFSLICVFIPIKNVISEEESYNER